jgi:hypothetical protein
VFSNENWPVQTNGHPAWGWGGNISVLEKAEHTDRQCVCVVEETVEQTGQI